MSILFLQAGGSSLDFGEKQVAPKNKSLQSEEEELQLPPEELNNMRAPETEVRFSVHSFVTNFTNFRR